MCPYGSTGHHNELTTLEFMEVGLMFLHTYQGGTWEQQALC